MLVLLLTLVRSSFVRHKEYYAKYKKSNIFTVLVVTETNAQIFLVNIQRIGTHNILTLHTSF
jgi:hypothetical protein